MAKRDPAKTALNRQIAAMTSTLRGIQAHAQEVLKEESVQALHGRIGGKNAEFIDVKEEVILSPEMYVASWIRGFLRVLDARRPLQPGDSYYEIFLAFRDDPRVKEYIVTFLKRTYLRNSEALSRVRPSVEQAEIWIGQNLASYGLLVTPRFVNDVWENDKSEIRHFKQDYWTIGHVVETGLVVPGDQDRIRFSDVDAFLTFFKNTLVRAPGSKYEKEIAKRYVAFVRSKPDPLKVPLLIPELRYGGIAGSHKYRLDFTVIDPITLEKVGFELSPWSTHGQLTGVAKKTQAQVNDEARGNFEREMKKHKDYFRKHGIYALIYTDQDLAALDEVFSDIAKYLEPKKISHQLELHALDELDRFKV